MHNKLRNDLATGKVKGFATAVRMGAMTWDEELASMVSLNIKRCEFGHDEEFRQCRNTKNYPASGQNIGFRQGPPHGTFNRAAVIEETDNLINKWFSEYKDADMTVIRKYMNKGVGGFDECF